MPRPVAGLGGDDLDLGDGELQAAEQLHRRQVSEEQLRKFEGYAAEIFTALGLDLETPATRDTPRRFIRALLWGTLVGVKRGGVTCFSGMRFPPQGKAQQPLDAITDAGQNVRRNVEGGSAVECSICGRPTTLLIGGQPTCEQCYENAGSCCLEFGGEDLWQRQEEDSHESRLMVKVRNAEQNGGT